MSSGDRFTVSKNIKDQDLASKSMLHWLESIRYFLILSSKHKIARKKLTGWKG